MDERDSIPDGDSSFVLSSVIATALGVTQLHAQWVSEPLPW